MSEKYARQQEEEYGERVRLGKLMRDAKADERAMIMYRHTMGSRVFDFARRSEAPLMFTQALKALEDAGYRIEKPMPVEGLMDLQNRIARDE